MLGTLCFEWEDGKWETSWLLDGIEGYLTFKIKDLNIEHYTDKLA